MQKHCRKRGFRGGEELWISSLKQVFKGSAYKRKDTWILHFNTVNKKQKKHIHLVDKDLK